jgi:hypothetical protein
LEIRIGLLPKSHELGGVVAGSLTIAFQLVQLGEPLVREWFQARSPGSQGVGLCSFVIHDGGIRLVRDIEAMRHLNAQHISQTARILPGNPYVRT